MSPIDQMTMALYGKVRTDAWATGTCVRCGEEPDLSTETGRQEYRQSALCLKCWDDIFPDPDDGPDSTMSESADDLNKL